MAISREDVINVAKLSRIELSHDEIDMFTQQLGAILTYIEKLNELDTSSVEPMLTAAPAGDVFRDDQLRPSLPVDIALKNAPLRENDMFGVPQVIDDGGGA